MYIITASDGRTFFASSLTRAMRAARIQARRTLNKARITLAPVCMTGQIAA